MDVYRDSAYSNPKTQLFMESLRNKGTSMYT